MALRRGRAGASSAFFTDLAYAVARRRFGGASVDGPWPYYEEMGKYVESGVYDAGSDGRVPPETDTSTFNGHIWRLARQTFFEDPDSIAGARPRPRIAPR